ncbi:hypothetical protein ACWGI8_05215 [Streptomyces sp. NPDC054841]
MTDFHPGSDAPSSAGQPYPWAQGQTDSSSDPDTAAFFHRLGLEIDAPTPLPDGPVPSMPGKPGDFTDTPDGRGKQRAAIQVPTDATFTRYGDEHEQAPHPNLSVHFAGPANGSNLDELDMSPGADVLGGADAVPSGARPARLAVLACTVLAGAALLSVPLLLPGSSADSTSVAAHGEGATTDIPPQIPLVTGSAWTGPTDWPTNSTTAEATSPSNTHGKSGASGAHPTATSRNRATTPSMHNPEVDGPKPSTTPTERVTYDSVAGYGCPAGTGSYRHVGRYENGQEGWYTLPSGGFDGGGCSGAFEAVPMSGSATSDDPNAFAEWTFSVGSPSRECTISAFVPSGATERDAAGAPAFYTIRSSSTGSAYSTFAIDQTTRRGQWVTGKKVQPQGTNIVVRLHNRGEDWSGTTRTNAHIGAAQLSVRCTG